MHAKWDRGNSAAGFGAPQTGASARAGCSSLQRSSALTPTATPPPPPLPRLRAANERTFLSWCGMATTMGGVSSAMVGLSASSSAEGGDGRLISKKTVRGGGGAWGLWRHVGEGGGRPAGRADAAMSSEAGARDLAPSAVPGGCPIGLERRPERSQS